MTFVINTRTMILSVLEGNTEKAVRNSKEARGMVSEWLYENFDPPFPPRLILTKAQTVDLRAELKAVLAAIEAARV